MSVLMNFKMSEHNKTLLDHIAASKHITKTSILNNLLETYLRTELDALKQDKEFAERLVIASNRYKHIKQKLEPRSNPINSEDLTGFMVTNRDW